MQQRCGFYRFELPVVGDPQESRDFHGVLLHSLDVTVRDLILRVDRHGECLDRRHVHSLNRIQSALHLVNPAR